MRSYFGNRHLFGLILLIAMAALWIVPGISLNPIVTTGEGREATVAQEMLVSGNWVLPRRYGGEIHAKPPGTHWIMVGAAFLLGKNSEIAVRLPSALASIFLLMGLYLFLCKRTSLVHALLSSLVLLGSIEWLRASIVCRVDLPLAAAMAGALLLLYCWEERGLQGWPWGSGLLCTLALLIKGPVGLVLPGMIGAIYWYIRRWPLSLIVKAGLKLATLPLIVGSWWYLEAWRAGGQEFVDVVLAENFHRFTSTMSDDRGRHEHNLGYLLGTLWVGFLPWALVLLMKLPASVRMLMRPRSAHGIVKRYFANLSSLEIFSWTVILVTIAFYSIPASKRSVYLLPLYPFAAIIIADWLMRLVRVGDVALRSSVAAVSVVVITVLMVLISIYMEPGPLVNRMLSVKAMQELEIWLGFIQTILNSIGMLALVLFLGLGGIAFLTFVTTLRGSQRTQLMLGVMLYVAVLYSLNWWLYPAYSNSISASGFAEDIASLSPSAARLCSYDDRYFALDYYLDNRLEHCSPSDLPTEERLMIVRTQLLSELRALAQRPLVIVAKAKQSIGKPGRQLVLVKWPGRMMDGVASGTPRK